MLWRMPADLRRERIGMIFINSDASRAAARSRSAACTTRAVGRRLVPDRHRLVQKTGGKGGNPFPGPYSGTKEFPVAAARIRAISCRIPAGSGRSRDRRLAKRLRELRKSLSTLLKVAFTPLTGAWLF